MARDRERVLEELLIGPASDGRDGNEYLVSTLRYEMGGMNYFSGKQGARGYYVGVSPITIGGGFRSFMLFSGIKGLVLEAKAFSDKKLAALTVSPEYVAKLKRHVLNEMRLAVLKKSSSLTPEQHERLVRIEALLAELSPVEEEVK